MTRLPLERAAVSAPGDVCPDLPAGLPAAIAELAAAPHISDAELVRRTLAGQQDPFAALVARYQKRAFWIAFHVVGRVEDARDVTQEAFVRLFRSLARYDLRRAFYTWFYRIVMNLAIDQLRKRRSSRTAPLDDVLPGLPDEREAAGSAPLERIEEHQLVWRVLERLDARFRAVLVLRDIHGLSCREIAPILRLTHATARWRLHRGRQMFRDQWERLAHDGGAPTEGR
ncbi:MAG: sigma-70 family RNA polymerase sigma factor [Planctomycetes bacterium]|nr:sigma-70 family RNA polymerase sigma factor [Planctomycetota bacterium]